jgi:hypothetical protein
MIYRRMLTYIWQSTKDIFSSSKKIYVVEWFSHTYFLINFVRIMQFDVFDNLR